MSTKPQSSSSEPGHETRDADVAFIFLVGVALLLLLLLVFLATWLTLRHLRVGKAEKENRTARVVDESNMFPDPRLQVDPGMDLAQMRVRDARALNAFGWIDRKAGVARIPIDRAMQLLLAHGLPDVGQNQTPLALMQARPAAKNTPAPRRKRY